MVLPIIFAIDDNVVVPCGVTIASLLHNAKDETVYEIYILYNGSNLSSNNRNQLLKAFDNHDKSSLRFIDVGDAFRDTPLHSNNHITTATYYRLLIPTLFPQFEKVIYSDVDIIFQRDLSELMDNPFPDNELLAAVPDLTINYQYFFKSSLPYKVGKTEQTYVNAGFLVLNLSQMRKEGIVKNFEEQCQKGHAENDQDVLNVVCDGRVNWIDNLYNFQTNHFANYMWNKKNEDLTFSQLLSKGTLHYTGPHKPWNSLECVASDAWWHYYRESPFYEDAIYFKQQYEQIESYRNNFSKKSNVQLLCRILVNIKRYFLK